VLTSAGFGDIMPVTRQARALCVLEQLAGALFTAILIARLAGVYHLDAAEASDGQRKARQCAALFEQAR